MTLREAFETVVALFAVYEYNRINKELADAKKAIRNLQERIDQLPGPSSGS